MESDGGDEADRPDVRGEGRAVRNLLIGGGILVAISVFVGLLADLTSLLSVGADEFILGSGVSVGLVASAVAAEAVRVGRTRHIAAWIAIVALSSVAAGIGIRGLLDEQPLSEGHPPQSSTQSPSPVVEATSTTSIRPSPSWPESPRPSSDSSNCTPPSKLSFPPQRGKRFRVTVDPGCPVPPSSTRWIVVELLDIGEGVPHSEFYFKWQITQANPYQISVDLGNCSIVRNYFVVDLTGEARAKLAVPLPNEDPILKPGELTVVSEIYKVTC